MDPVYGYQGVNVEAQGRSPSSLLNWMRRLIAVRKAHQALSRGRLRFIRPGNRKILVYLREHDDEAILCVANLSRSSQPVELDLAMYKGRIPVELVGNTAFPPIGELPYLLTLPAWGFYWFALTTDAAYPKWHAERPVPQDLPVLVIPEGLKAALSQRDAQAADLRALLGRRVREQLEREVLPVFLEQQRWFAGKGSRIAQVTLREQDEWRSREGSWLLAVAQVDFASDPPQTYSLPLALAFEDHDPSRIEALLHATVARVRQRARVGVLYDAFWDDGFCRSLVAAMRNRTRLTLPGGELRFSSTSRLADEPDAESLPVRHPAFEQSNSLVVLGERLVLKGYRQLRRGVNPEIEIGRFLTDVSPFPHIAPLYGSLESCDGEGHTTAIAVLHRYVPNEGSGWDYTLAHLHRLVDDVLTGTSPETTLGPGSVPPPPPLDPGGPMPHSVDSGFLALIGLLGRRTAEMHAALARPSGDPAFEPEPFTADDLARLRDKLQTEARETLALLEHRRAALPAPVAAMAERLAVSARALREHIDGLIPAEVDATRTRYHGDYHLGQVLLSQHDFVIVDFEGEPSRPLPERRAKHSPLRDVAGMLRSFGYAAAVALQQMGPGSAAERERTQAPLAQWRQATSEAFLGGYREAIASTSSWPRDPAVAGRLIALFTLEKALYELRYELANRPDWVAIPLAAVLDPLTAAP
jgi:maltose alpha-D-glucosyltransferase/alpha-amylase